MSIKRIQEIESRLRVIEVTIQGLEQDIQTADHGAYAQQHYHKKARIENLRREARQLKDEQREIWGIPVSPAPEPREVRNEFRDPRDMMRKLADAKDRLHPEANNPYREALQ